MAGLPHIAARALRALAFGAALCAPLIAAAGADAIGVLGPPLKPNLIADPPVEHGIEIAEWSGAKRLLLRFDGYIHNRGPGRLEIRGRRASAAEPMHVYQRLYREGAQEVHGEQPSFEYEEVPDPGAQLAYDTDDGHDHFHLEEVAHYSLWSLDRSHEVAPAQKVGFCLTDSEHVEPGVGPSEPFYHDEEERHFCDYLHPEALSVWEGISVGWRDTYAWDVTLQWVDVSNVAPGEYWLREDVDPKGMLVEAGSPGEAAKHAFAGKPTLVPGFDAVGEALADPADAPERITLGAVAYGVPGEPRFGIAQAPRKGTLGPIEGNQVTYTPAPGAGGVDSFSFYAVNPSSPYPLTPAQATVSLSLGTPSVAITSAPATMRAGSSAQLAASTSEYEGTVQWSASAGTITPGGLFTAPKSAGIVTVTARAGSASAQRTIVIEPPPRPWPGPRGLRAVIHGRWLILSARAGHAGWLRLSAYRGRRKLGSCTRRARAGQRVGCRIRLHGLASARQRLGVWASMRIAGHLLQEHRVVVWQRSRRRR